MFIIRQNVNKIREKKTIEIAQNTLTIYSIHIPTQVQTFSVFRFVFLEAKFMVKSFGINIYKIEKQFFFFFL